MFRRTITPRTYSKITLVALVALSLIVITGGAVRLTDSGLGCPDWPTCTESRLVAPVQYHAMVEFTNRVITGLVSVTVIVAVLASFAVHPRRKDLIWLSAGLVMGVVGQIVLGGLTVLFHLHPALVASHLVLSMVIIANAVVLYFRSRENFSLTRAAVVSEAPMQAFTKMIIVATAFVILLGTVVTGSGPHGGDEKAKRFGFVIGDVARLHGAAVVLLLGIVLYTTWLVKSNQELRPLLIRVESLLGVLVAQAAIGYTQYFTGVPALLVGFHLVGAVTVWVAAWWLSLETRSLLAPPKTKPAGITTKPLAAQ